MNKKILILTASTGGGHNQVAKNLKIKFEESSNKVEILDIFDTNEIVNDIVQKGYMELITKLKDPYEYFYHFFNKDFFNKKILKNMFILIRAKIFKEINKINPDIIISTHPFAVSIIGRLKEKEEINIPFIQIITDFNAHYSYIYDTVDAYIVGSEYTKKTLINKNVSEDKIYVYGIPISEDFKIEKRKKDSLFKVLIMGGSLGIKKMEQSVDILVKSNIEMKLTIVCGKNERLYNKLYIKYANNSNVLVLGYVDNINELMDESYLIITKPGGITATEAITKNIPMIIPYSYMGQEKENIAFLINEFVALDITNINLLPEYIISLINNPEIYNKMVLNMKKISSDYSIEGVIEVANKLIEKKN